jgi:phosphopantothenoylcysteine synthetase/decarboxylase
VKILITAGPTREQIDPVRFLSNKSSGRMGYSLAHAFIENHDSVLLISGPTSLDIPDQVDFIPVESANEMYDVVARHINSVDIAIFCAAVADYSPAEIAAQKIKKNSDSITLTLVRTKDILGSARNQFQFKGYLVGFAAETENLESNAYDKLIKKSCDLILANDVSKSGIGFESSENEVILIQKNTSLILPRATKDHLSHQIVAFISEQVLLKQKSDDLGNHLI